MKQTKSSSGPHRCKALSGIVECLGEISLRLRTSENRLIPAYRGRQAALSPGRLSGRRPSQFSTDYYGVSVIRSNWHLCNYDRISDVLEVITFSILSL